jgi:hypothetical protein
LLFKVPNHLLSSFNINGKNVNVINMRFTSFTVGYQTMIDNLAKDTYNFPSEQMTFQLEVAEITRKNSLELHAHKQAKGKAW